MVRVTLIEALCILCVDTSKAEPLRAESCKKQVFHSLFIANAKRHVPKSRDKPSIKGLHLALFAVNSPRLPRQGHCVRPVQAKRLCPLMQSVYPRL